MALIFLTGCFDFGDSSNSEPEKRNKPKDDPRWNEEVQREGIGDASTWEPENTIIDVSGPTPKINGFNLNPPPRPNNRLPVVDKNGQKNFAPVLNEIANKYGVDPYLVHSIVSQETRYARRHLIRNSFGAVGLMQVKDTTGPRYGCPNAQLMNIRCNVTAGVRYLKFLTQTFNGNLQTIAAGYNAGEGAAMSYLNGTKMPGKNPRGRKTPNGVPVASFGYFSKEQASRCGGKNVMPGEKCEGQTYHYVRNVTGFYLRYKRQPQLIGLRESTLPSAEANKRGVF